MANDKEIKIKVVIDDSQEKKYYSESESRRKKSTAQETEEERRKTALLKSQLNEQYANLKQALDKELEAKKQGNRLEIKAAIEKRKVLESELRQYEESVRSSNRRILEEVKQANRLELLDKRNAIKQFDSAPKTRLRGSIGSEAYVSQLIAAQKTMLPGSDEFNKTGVLIERYQTNLKSAGREVKSLAQQIGGELNTSLAGASAQFLQSTASALGLTLGLQQLISFTSKAIQEFAKEEASIRGLEASVTRITGQNVNLAKSLEDYSQELQRNYNVNDDAIRQQLSYLVIQGRSEKQIKEITNAAIDWAAVQGDLSDENVIQNISKLDGTYEGVLGKLAKYDSRLKDLTPEQLKNGDAVRLLGQKYKGMADEIDKGSLESVRSVKILWNTFLEFAGSIFTREGALLKGITTLNKSLKEGQGGWYSYTLAIREAAGTLPIVGGEMSSLIGIMQNLLGITGELQTAMRDFQPPTLNLKNMRQGFTGTYEEAIRSLVNGYGFSWEQAREMIDKEFPSAKENEANSPTRTSPTKNSGSRNKTTKEIEEQLNLIKKLEEDLAKAQKRLEANRNDIGAERDIRAEILEIEKKIYYYRTGQVNDSPFKMRSPVDDLMEWQSGFKPKGVDRNPRWNNDANDLTPEEVARRQEETYGKILGYTDGMFNNFTGMLEATGLMSNDVQSFVSFIQNAVKFLNSSGGLVQDVIGFFGSVFGAPSTEGGASSGGFMNPMSGGMPGSVMYRNSITVEAIPNEYLEYKITSKGNAEIARRGTGVY